MITDIKHKPTCDKCCDSGWVCRAHPEYPSAVVLDGGCSCGSSACNCLCNPDGDHKFEVAFASTDPAQPVEVLQ